MDGRPRRHLPVRGATPGRQRSCARRKSLPRPRQFPAASSETRAHRKPAAFPPPTPGGERKPYRRIACESSFLVVRTETRNERRTLLRAFRSERQPAELKDGGHREADRLSQRRKFFKKRWYFGASRSNLRLSSARLRAVSHLLLGFSQRNLDFHLFLAAVDGDFHRVSSAVVVHHLG